MLAKSRLLILCSCVTILGLISSVTIGPFYHIIIWREKFDKVIEYRVVPEDDSLKPYKIDINQVNNTKSRICIVTSFIEPYVSYIY